METLREKVAHVQGDAKEFRAVILGERSNTKANNRIVRTLTK